MVTLPKLVLVLLLFLSSYEIQTAEITQFFSDYDQDHNQAISEAQIIRKLKQDDLDNQVQVSNEYYEQVISPLFQFYDTNKDGHLDMEEFQYFANDIVQDVQGGQSTEQEEQQEKEESQQLGQSVNEEEL